MRLTLDYETRSACKLDDCGAAVYAMHPTTSVLCAAVTVEDEDPQIYLPPWVRDMPGVMPLAIETLGFPLIYEPELFKLFDAASEIEAHNNFFEHMIWKYVCHQHYGWPTPPINKFRCSMAKCCYYTLPRGLDAARKALGLPEGKDIEGSKLMRKMCVPWKPGKKEEVVALEAEGFKVDKNKNIYDGQTGEIVYKWQEKPEQIVRLAQYCAQDVITEHALSEALPDIPATELENWQQDQLINARGVCTDTVVAKQFMDEIDTRAEEAQRIVTKITDGQVERVKQVDKLKTWLVGQGLELENLQKDTVETALKRKDLSADVRTVLTLRRLFGGAATSKYPPILLRTCPDGRYRGAFMFFGAATGRFSSLGIQLHNMFRGKFKDSVACIALFSEYGYTDYMEALYGDFMPVASTCIRGMFTAADGHILYVGDFSSVEARFNAWVAGEETDLDAFRHGKDLYKVTAALIFNTTYDKVTKKQRQVGKTAVLALGYGGGIAAFAKMAENYGINLEELPEFVLHLADERMMELARANATRYVKANPGNMSFDAAVACDIIKQLWRRSHPRIVKFWADLEQAAVLAVKNPGHAYFIKGANVAYKVEGNFLKCKIPSGRYLHYFKPHLVMKTPPWEADKPKEEQKKKEVVAFYGTCSKPGPMNGKFIPQHLYGGLQCENVCQAGCRDLLTPAMLRLEKAGYPIVLHVHDEAVAEVPIGFGSEKEFGDIMAEVPAWAKGLPIGVEVFTSRRYRK